MQFTAWSVLGSIGECSLAPCLVCSSWRSLLVDKAMILMDARFGVVEAARFVFLSMPFCSSLCL